MDSPLQLSRRATQLLFPLFSVSPGHRFLSHDLKTGDVLGIRDVVPPLSVIGIIFTTWTGSVTVHFLGRHRVDRCVCVCVCVLSLIHI